MAHPNEVLAREAYAAFGRGDMDALHQNWAENIRWHSPGRGPLAGDYEGAAQVLGLFGRLFELSGDTWRTETHDVLANDEHVVVLYTGRAERTGKQLELDIAQIYRIRDGKVTEEWGYPADLYAWDEFWS
jgi:ketosteroid isomerase-like protein